MPATDPPSETSSARLLDGPPQSCPPARAKQLRSERIFGAVTAVAAGTGLGAAKLLGLAGLKYMAASLAISTAAALGALAVALRLTAPAAAACVVAPTLHGSPETRDAEDRATTHSQQRGLASLVTCKFAELTAVVAGSSIFFLTFHTAYCGLLFRCGCTWPWAGGDINCNLFNPTGPKCPWCVARPATAWTKDSLVLTMMILAYSEGRLKSNRPWLWLSLPPATYFVVSFVVAFAFKVCTGYPYFLFGRVHGKIQ